MFNNTPDPKDPETKEEVENESATATETQAGNDEGSEDDNNEE